MVKMILSHFGAEFTVETFRAEFFVVKCKFIVADFVTAK